MPWEKELVKEKRNELKKAYLKNKRLPKSDNANYLKQAKEELQAAYDSEQVEYLAQKCAEIENAAVQHQAKRVWDTTNEITGRTSSATGRLKRQNCWSEAGNVEGPFCHTLRPTSGRRQEPSLYIVQDTIPISTSAYTFEELNTSINTFANNKAPDIDEIPAEV